MPFHQLAHLVNSSNSANGTLLLRLIYVAGEVNLSLAAVASVFQQAAKSLPTGRLQLELVPIAQDTIEQAAIEQTAVAQIAVAPVIPAPRAQICLWLADAESTRPSDEVQTLAIAACKNASYWGATGAAVLWLAQAACLDDLQVALAWPLHADAVVDNACERVQFNSHLYEIDQHFISCCGGAASLDFALSLVLGLYGHPLQSKIKDALHVELIRNGNEKQRQSAQNKVLPPKLTEVLALMQANIEEPLSSDDLANLVDISRRQLERLFKQYLGNLPSRYYLELRLQKARQLLLESHHSIVQIGLMCGFSSGSHFSTAFSALFGITPREERQRKMHV